MAPASRPEAPAQTAPPDGTAPFRETDLMPIDLAVDRRRDGTIILASRIPLAPYVANMAAELARQAAALGDKPFLARREGAERAWRMHSFAATKRDSDAVAQWLLDRAIAPGRALLILSGNSIPHAVMTYGGWAAGVPDAPISAQYAAMGGDFGRLRHVVKLTRPAVVFAEDAAACREALETVDFGDATIVTGDPGVLRRPAVAYADVLRTPVTEAVAARIAALDPDAPASYMLTSGSTGLPKAVVLTQRMLTSNVAQCYQAVGKAAGWHERLVDWLPWSHAAGAFGLRAVMIYGGTLYIDDGRPLPGLFDETIRNLREIPVSYWGTVPLSYAMLADALERDDVLRQTFFSQMRLLLYGGAGLPQHVYDRIQRAAVRTVGRRIMMTSGYGATEATSSFMVIHFETDKIGVGLPVPGAVVKLVPHDDRYEVRVAGPMVTPGYLQGDAQIFDEEGFYKLGDLARFHDEADPTQGLAFAGRLAEEFKLASGAWVYGGQLRDGLLKALAPLCLDLVICGDSRPNLAILAWPNPQGVRGALKADAGADVAGLIRSPAFRDDVAARLRAHNAAHPSLSMRIDRCLFLTDPPSANAHEMSDKGTINRRIVMERRAADVSRLYAEGPDADVIVP
jgi:feruloyl-CoA synthase